MGNTPVFTVGPTGGAAPEFADALNYFFNGYTGIYGADTYLGGDTQDGQFLALLAEAVDDCNTMAGGVYESFAPQSAQGIGLSNVVRVNGIMRNVASYSTALLTVVGQAYTVIQNGVALDEIGYLWSLPPVVNIPFSGQIDVTATCQTLGSITADSGSINQISNNGSAPGWQTVINANPATAGLPVETDPQLKARQALSASMPSVSQLYGIVAAILALPGVQAAKLFANEGPAFDVGSGIPGNSLALVINGALSQIITDTLAIKKGPGVNTFGTFTVPSTPDAFGIVRTISYSPVVSVPITVQLTVQPLVGFTTDVFVSIQNSIVNWINALGMGAFGISVVDLTLPARLYGGVNSNTFKIIPGSIQIARDGSPTQPDDLSLAYNEQPACVQTNVNVIVL